MKSAKPNKGQCIEMKQRLLTALGIRRSARVFVWWGVPYNPYGTASAYAHPYPLRYFDFKDDVKLGPGSGTSSVTTPAHSICFSTSIGKSVRNTR